MDYHDLLAALLPPVSYQPQAAAVFVPAAAAFTRIESRAGALALAPFARADNDFLARWEAVLGIAPAGNMQLRAATVLARLNATGGLSIAYFKRLAAAQGFSVDIQELDSFRAGVGRAGERLNGEDAVWTWVIRVSGQAVRRTRFRAGVSRAGDRLSEYGTPQIEDIFQELKPAWTTAIFQYED